MYIYKSTGIGSELSIRMFKYSRSITSNLVKEELGTLQLNDVKVTLVILTTLCHPIFTRSEIHIPFALKEMVKLELQKLGRTM